MNKILLTILFMWIVLNVLLFKYGNIKNCSLPSSEFFLLPKEAPKEGDIFHLNWNNMRVELIDAPFTGSNRHSGPCSKKKT